MSSDQLSVIFCQSSFILPICTVLYDCCEKIFLIVWKRCLSSLYVSATSAHLYGIARIAVPIDWAISVVCCFDIVLAAHPHGYTQAVHMFCGHRGCRYQRPHSLRPFPARNFMGPIVKDRLEKAASPSTSGFIPWSQSMGIQLLTISYPVCGCSGVIHNFSSSRGD